jgi:hypothetical protein
MPGFRNMSFYTKVMNFNLSFVLSRGYVVQIQMKIKFAQLLFLYTSLLNFIEIRSVASDMKYAFHCKDITSSLPVNVKQFLKRIQTYKWTIIIRKTFYLFTCPLPARCNIWSLNVNKYFCWCLMGRDLNWILCSAWKKWIGGTPLKHPPYSPDLAPCDFWAFSTMKRELRGKKFRSDQQSAERFREVSGAL